MKKLLAASNKVGRGDKESCIQGLPLRKLRPNYEGAVLNDKQADILKKYKISKRVAEAMHVKKEKGERNPYQGEATRSKRARNTLAAAQATSIREKARTMTLEKLVYLPKPLRDADPDLGVTVNAIPNSNWYGTLHIADCDVVLVNSLTSLDDCVNGIDLHYELLLLNLLHGEQHHSCSTTIMSCSCSTCCFTPDSKWSELTTPAQLAAWRAASKPLTEVSNLQQLHRMSKSMRIVEQINSNLDFC